MDALPVEDHILKGRSVVVCAPTGAGKTCIAEASAAAALAKGKRVIYTTPLKVGFLPSSTGCVAGWSHGMQTVAVPPGPDPVPPIAPWQNLKQALSNQKLAEMREKFGEQRVGLQTGDASLNTEGDLVVMTTEILRNIMYRTAVENNPDLSPLASVGLIVLDEVHYLGDPNRGSVWEEVIINCPKHIQMLCMSATVQNPRDLGGWIQQVRTSHSPWPQPPLPPLPACGDVGANGRGM